MLASNFKRIESRFCLAKLPELITYNPSYIIGFGVKCYLINSNPTLEIQSNNFGVNVGCHVLQLPANGCRAK